jgi:hypothetical protein
MRRARVAWDECDLTYAPGPDESAGERRGEPAVIADVARCPICRAPMQAVLGRRGPYVHCLCAEKRRR